MSSDSVIRYDLSMPVPSTHYFRVEILVDAGDADRLRFVMPVWTPGSYLVREFPRNVVDFTARERSSGKKLESRKDTKYSWVVNTDGVGEVAVTYRVYAHELTVDTSFLDDSHGIINGASVFMYIEGMESRPIELAVKLFGGWKTLSTGLPLIEGRGSGARIYAVKDFDTLVDSPIEAGNQEVYDFTVDSVRHQVSILGLDGGFHEKLVNDIRKIVEHTIPVIGEIPYERYVFIIDFTDEKSGGLEHLNSTYCMLPRLRLQPDEEYRKALSLFSHEFFHAWNVKRMRPVGLGPFDYRSEVYTRSLWVAEGVTSYYDNLILRRAGIVSAGEYLDLLCEDINAIASLPGSSVESAEEASFDTWIRLYRPDENSPNVGSSYYNQGAVIGWMIDMEVRRQSDSIRSLDDIMRQAYVETYKRGRGYTDEEFERICTSIGGAGVSKIFEARVRGREKVDSGAYFACAGLRLVPKGKKEQRKGFLGVKLRTDSGRTVVSTRLSGSPAEEAGLSVGDEILGANGMRLDGVTLPYFISTLGGGNRANFTIARNGIIRELACDLGSYPIFEYRAVKLETAADDQKRLYSNWLHEPWSTELKFPEYAQYPRRRQLFDYI